MKDLIMQNEQAMLVDVLKVPFSSIKIKNGAKRLFFAGDNTFICDYLLTSFGRLNTALSVFQSVTYLRTGGEADYRQSTLREIEDVAPLDTLQKLDNNDVVFFFVDCVNGLGSKDITLAALRAITDLLKTAKHTKCVVSVLLPPIPNFSSEIETL